MRKNERSNPMERLLNIKEAAEYLNVSEMTVRRWTNDGSLRCYRVGGKRERRFTIQDLHEYLAGGSRSDEPKQVPLGFGGFNAPDGSHMTHLYQDSREALEVGTSYLLQGLNNQETVLLVAPADRTEAFMRMLKEHGADVERFQRKNMLHTSDGMEDPVKQAAFISDVASASTGRFRLLGDMLWTRSKGWSLEDLRDLEEMAVYYGGASGRFFLCQYPLDAVSGQEAMMALETHDHAVFRGEIRRSPYFRQV
jgi:excisionase family DNA binding protein